MNPILIASYLFIIGVIIWLIDGFIKVWKESNDGISKLSLLAFITNFIVTLVLWKGFFIIERPELWNAPFQKLFIFIMLFGFLYIVTLITLIICIGIPVTIFNIIFNKKNKETDDEKEKLEKIIKRIFMILNQSLESKDINPDIKDYHAPKIKNEHGYEDWPEYRVGGKDGFDKDFAIDIDLKMIRSFKLGHISKDMLKQYFNFKYLGHDINVSTWADCGLLYNYFCYISNHTHTINWKYFEEHELKPFFNAIDLMEILLKIKDLENQDLFKD